VIDPCPTNGTVVTYMRTALVALLLAPQAGYRRPHAVIVHDDAVGCGAAPRIRGSNPPLCKVVGRRAEADIIQPLEQTDPGRRIYSLYVGCICV